MWCYNCGGVFPHSEIGAASVILLTFNSWLIVPFIQYFSLEQCSTTSFIVDLNSVIVGGIHTASAFKLPYLKISIGC